VPSKRQRVARQVARRRITPAAVTAFKAGDAVALERALGIPPWAVSPLDVDEPDPPDWSTPGVWRDTWPEAWALREALEEEVRRAD
jgi:hypothetical protein